MALTESKLRSWMKAKKAVAGKGTHLLARTIQDAKGFVPGGNIWYAQTALENLVWRQVMDQLSPGYLESMRSRTMRQSGQQWWWGPGEVVPERLPGLEKAIEALTPTLGTAVER